MAPKKSQIPDNLKDLYDLRNLIEQKCNEEEKINDELNFIESIKYHISNRDNLNEIEVSILNELINFTESCNHSSGLNFIKANQSNLTRLINKYNKSYPDFKDDLREPLSYEDLEDLIKRFKRDEIETEHIKKTVADFFYGLNYIYNDNGYAFNKVYWDDFYSHKTNLYEYIEFNIDEISNKNLYKDFKVKLKKCLEKYLERKKWNENFNKKKLMGLI